MDRPIEEEWRNFELYEKVRVRENRKRIVFLLISVLLFLGLCSVPVFEERLPKWRSLRAASELSVALEKLKTLAIREKKPIRIHFLDQGRYEYQILQSCESEVPIRTEEAQAWKYFGGELQVLTAAEAKILSLKLATDSICFDPVFGLDGVKTKKVVVVAPVKDLAEHRLDRASYIILEGESAKISIN